MSLKSVVFAASYPQPEKFGLMQTKKVVFELGLGPCGLVVIGLWATLTSEALIITQQTGVKSRFGRVYNRETKTFIYKIADIHGRIVTTSRSGR